MKISINEKYDSRSIVNALQDGLPIIYSHEFINGKEYLSISIIVESDEDHLYAHYFPRSICTVEIPEKAKNNITDFILYTLSKYKILNIENDGEKTYTLKNIEFDIFKV